MLDAYITGALRGLCELAQIFAAIGLLGIILQWSLRDFHARRPRPTPPATTPYDPATDPQHDNIGPGTVPRRPQ